MGGKELSAIAPYAALSLSFLPLTPSSHAPCHRLCLRHHSPIASSATEFLSNVHSNVLLLSTRFATRAADQPLTAAPAAAALASSSRLSQVGPG